MPHHPNSHCLLYLTLTRSHFTPRPPSGDVGALSSIRPPLSHHSRSLALHVKGRPACDTTLCRHDIPNRPSISHRFTSASRLHSCPVRPQLCVAPRRSASVSVARGALSHPCSFSLHAGPCGSSFTILTPCSRPHDHLFYVHVSCLVESRLPARPSAL